MKRAAEQPPHATAYTAVLHRILKRIHAYAIYKKMKTTQYFEYTRKRPDRAQVKNEWIE
jgi:hypothetical protein